MERQFGVSMPEKPPSGDPLPFRPREVRDGSAVPAATLALSAAEMLERGFVYRAYCRRCDESRLVDLKRLVRIGQGGRILLGCRLICRRCGNRGTGEIRRATDHG